MKFIEDAIEIGGEKEDGVFQANPPCMKDLVGYGFAPDGVIKFLILDRHGAPGFGGKKTYMDGRIKQGLFIHILNGGKIGTKDNLLRIDSGLFLKLTESTFFWCLSRLDPSFGEAPLDLGRSNIVTQSDPVGSRMK